MTDIVQRLRGEQDRTDYLGPLFCEAADEIEKLRGAVIVLRAQVVSLHILRAALRRICEPITVTGDSDSSSACRDLHDLICAQARAALGEEP